MNSKEVDNKIESIAKKIIGRLNGYCLKLDHRGLGLPALDENAMIEMQNIIVKIILRSEIGKHFTDSFLEMSDEEFIAGLE